MKCKAVYVTLAAAAASIAGQARTLSLDHPITPEEAKTYTGPEFIENGVDCSELHAVYDPSGILRVNFLNKEKERVWYDYPRNVVRVKMISN